MHKHRPADRTFIIHVSPFVVFLNFTFIARWLSFRFMKMESENWASISHFIASQFHCVLHHHYHNNCLYPQRFIGIYINFKSISPSLSHCRLRFQNGTFLTETSQKLTSLLWRFLRKPKRIISENYRATYKSHVFMQCFSFIKSLPVNFFRFFFF